MDSYFCVAEFQDGVQIIPKNWIKDDKQCYWPPITNTLRYTKYVINREEPNESWACYKMKILGTYQDYETAKRKLRAAEENSDLNSTTDSEQAKKKRRIRHRKLIESSDEKELASSNEDTHSQIKPFPPPPNTSTTSLKTQKKYTTDISAEQNRKSLMVSPTVNVAEPSSSRVKMASLSDEDFKEKVCRELKTIKKTLEKFEELIKSTKNDRAEGGSVQQGDDIFVNFPVKNVEQLEVLEQKIGSDDDFKSQLILSLSRIGGCKVDEITKLILRRLLIDKFAALFSWLGAKKKRVFSELNLAEVILKSVRSNVSAAHCTEKEVIDSIKNWLRHAATRSQNQEKRIAARKEEEPQTLD